MPGFSRQKKELSRGCESKVWITNERRRVEMIEHPVEIKQVSEREIWVGESRFYLGEDNILHDTIVGEQNETAATEMLKVIDKFFELVDRKMNIIIDLNKTGRPSSGARKTAQQVLQNEKIGKVAFFGLHPVARVIASFVIGNVTKKDIHFFKTEEEALAWLRE